MIHRDSKRQHEGAEASVHAGGDSAQVEFTGTFVNPNGVVR